jgi:hypothetical protein
LALLDSRIFGQTLAGLTEAGQVLVEGREGQ